MPPRVLHVIYSLFRGGAERIIEATILSPGISRYEHLVCSLTGGGDLVESMRGAGARVFLIRKRHRGDLTAIPRLARLIRKEGIDILHLHGAPGAFWGTLAAVSGRTDIPIVRTEHRPYLPALLPWIYRALYPYITRKTDRVICVSRSVRESFAAAFPECADRHVIVANGIHLHAFAELPPKDECRRYFKLPISASIFGTVGRLVPVKNQALLIDTLSIVRQKIPDTHLAILGEGEMQGPLHAKAVDLGLGENVSIIKVTPDVARFIGALDVFALSSDSEGLPLTLLEAQAAGLPAVTTDVGGVGEVLDDGENGFLVPAGSPDALAERITALLLDREAAREMGKKGKERTAERFSADRMVEEVERIYDDVLKVGT